MILEKQLENELKKSFEELEWGCSFSDILEDLKGAEESILDLTILDVEYSLRLGKLIGYKLAKEVKTMAYYKGEKVRVLLKGKGGRTSIFVPSRQEEIWVKNKSLTKRKR